MINFHLIPIRQNVSIRVSIKGVTTVGQSLFPVGQAITIRIGFRRIRTNDKFLGITETVGIGIPTRGNGEGNRRSVRKGGIGTDSGFGDIDGVDNRHRGRWGLGTIQKL